MEVSCKTLDYLALREMKVESMIERIEKASNDLNEKIKDRHYENLREIDAKYNFIYRWVKRWKENIRYSYELAQSFSAMELCDHVINSCTQEIEKSNKPDQVVKDPPKFRRL
jgi:DNA-binding transcriptional regulator GbsR (MarR family)